MTLDKELICLSQLPQLLRRNNNGSNFFIFELKKALYKTIKMCINNFDSSPIIGFIISLLTNIRRLFYLPLNTSMREEGKEGGGALPPSPQNGEVERGIGHHGRRHLPKENGEHGHTFDTLDGRKGEFSHQKRKRINKN